MDWAALGSWDVQELCYLLLFKFSLHEVLARREDRENHTL